MENYFKKFKEKVIGNDATFTTPYGEQKMIYADWIASGRLYKDIEHKMSNVFGPNVGNTHTETSETGTIMTKSYCEAKQIIKDHVNANENDILINTGFGMTSAVNKLQRLLGLKMCGDISKGVCLREKQKPIVFVTHMEHHSNHTSWYETNADVVILEPGENLLVDLDKMQETLNKYKDRELKIGSFTACSNVTGIKTEYHKMAKIMHQNQGLCFVDFAANAPYSDIDMHPADPMEALDAIMFSPHKFLGGPGSSGILIFNKALYTNQVPDLPGGGTVDWTNAWGDYKYVDDIEAREDGGTPGFLQAIRAALAIKLKEEMGVENIEKREKELVNIAFEGLSNIDGLNILAPKQKDRIGAISFYFKEIHYNLVVKLLNDRFGVQVRGGCACAGTYGHILLDVDYERSQHITELINQGDLSLKPGWIRLSIHPTMTDEELKFIIKAVGEISKNYKEWSEDYIYLPKKNEFKHKDYVSIERYEVQNLFKL